MQQESEGYLSMAIVSLRSYGRCDSSSAFLRELLGKSLRFCFALLLMNYRKLVNSQVIITRLGVAKAVLQTPL